MEETYSRSGVQNAQLEETQPPEPIQESPIQESFESFMDSDTFRILFTHAVSTDMLMNMRLLNKTWHTIVDAIISQKLASGELMIHHGADVTGLAKELKSRARFDSGELERSLITQVAFLLNVTKVGAGACCYANNLVVVDIPEGITIINDSAFEGCVNLEEASFPTTLTFIGKFAFLNCKTLTKIDLFHTKLREIRDEAFAGSNLNLAMLPESLKTLGDDVFRDCLDHIPSDILPTDKTQTLAYLLYISVAMSNMDTGPIKIPKYKQRSHQEKLEKRVREIEASAAKMKAKALAREVRVALRESMPPQPPGPPKNNFMNTNDFRRLFVTFLPLGMLMKTRLLSKSWLEVSDKELDACTNSDAVIFIDGKDEDYRSNLLQSDSRRLVKDVIFLLNITQIGESSCCYLSKLASVEIPEGVESIGKSAFCHCSGLKKITFPTTLKSIAPRAFVSCLWLPCVDLLRTSVSEIGESAFEQCIKLKKFAVPDTLQTLGKNVFQDCYPLIPEHLYDDDSYAIVGYIREEQRRAKREEEQDVERYRLRLRIMEETGATMEEIDK
eukprot:CAMPEP_0182494864 /NCGR_PEP_ID=MMETSP1321-20130603/3694_1 /TAXON_ID=91990 /ORGANISM="Bolidomonas sp., Strain RCC1657" /LENGTH=556 /DNA_ID=CAMNT_0024698069 /DNA_START=896 /DNA_END=2563 /DNA_ORIENTATION=+